MEFTLLPMKRVQFIKSKVIFQFIKIREFFYTLRFSLGEVAYWRNFAELDYPDYCPHTEDSGSWKYGDFGEAPKEIQEKTGLQNYNLQMKYWGGVITQNAIISSDGTTVTCFDAQVKIL